MAIFNPSSSTLISPAPIPTTTLTTENISTLSLLDLRVKFGAWLYCRIGRRVSNALTRPGYIQVRPTLNGTIQNPSNAYDRVTSISSCVANVLTTSVSVGATSFLTANTSGFAAGDRICFQSPDSVAARVEFAIIANSVGFTIYLDRPTTIAHSPGDIITTNADVWDRMWIPGGDIWSIGAVNHSGQELIYEALGMTYDSDVSS